MTGKGHGEEAEELERDRDALLSGYAGLVPRGLDAFEPEDLRLAQVQLDR